MRDSQGFDMWADEYDSSVEQTEESDIYPFAGYKKVLNSIYSCIASSDNISKVSVLDIGFGTGKLTEKIYKLGVDVCGIDFSSKMLETAKMKMPNAKLYLHDFSKGLPKQLENSQFDFIISTYAIHHLTDEEKLDFISQLKKHLKANGKIIIGDVCFENEEKRLNCISASQESWDDEEYYIVAENFLKKVENATFEEVSMCAGIIEIM